jgi:hypothetical protein
MNLKTWESLRVGSSDQLFEDVLVKANEGKYSISRKPAKH